MSKRKKKNDTSLGIAENYEKIALRLIVKNSILIVS